MDVKSTIYRFVSCEGVLPEELFVRVNDSFRLSCAVREAEGELNFYENDERVPNANIKVWITTAKKKGSFD